MQAPGQPYAQPPRRGLPGWAWALIGCGLFGLLLGPIAIIAAILFPVFAQARAKAQAISCLSNTKQIARAMVMYAQDYDDRLPLARDWGDATSRYTGNRQVYVCPTARLNGESAAGGSSYAYNSKLNARRLRDLKYPAQTPETFESGADRWNASDPVESFLPRHQRHGSLAYADGHARMVSRPGPALPAKPGATAPPRP